jgi:phosphoglycolate phosphatase
MFWKGVLFDLDGTLLDTLADLSDAMNRVLRQMGFPQHSASSYRHFVGNGALVLVKRALPESKRNDDLVSSCLHAFLREYGENWMVKTRPYRGVPAMLDALTNRGFKMAVLSNKKDEITKMTVRELLSKWTFDSVVGQREDVPLKPDPAAAFEIADRLHIPPAEFAYLGDSAVDMETAVAAGMFPVGALWGFRPEDELVAGGARVLIREPPDLIEVLENFSVT